MRQIGLNLRLWEAPAMAALARTLRRSLVPVAFVAAIGVCGVAPSWASAPYLNDSSAQLDPRWGDSSARHSLHRRDEDGDRRRQVRIAPHQRAGALHAKRQRGKTRLASIGGEIRPPANTHSLTGGGVQWIASASCLNAHLRGVIASVASSYGAVRVTSTCRSPRHNRAVGGAGHSYHLTGNAADLVVHGNLRGAMAYLRSNVGGYKYYGGGRFHIDTGPKRTF